MTAAIIPLITDEAALYAAWIGARRAHHEGPTAVTEAECLRTFKPYYVRFIGKGWQDEFRRYYAAEVEWCRMIVARRRYGHGGSRAAPP